MLTDVIAGPSRLPGRDRPHCGRQGPGRVQDKVSGREEICLQVKYFYLNHLTAATLQQCKHVLSPLPSGRTIFSPTSLIKQYKPFLIRLLRILRC